MFVKYRSWCSIPVMCALWQLTLLAYKQITEYGSRFQSLRLSSANNFEPWLFLNVSIIVKILSERTAGNPLRTISSLRRRRRRSPRNIAAHVIEVWACKAERRRIDALSRQGNVKWKKGNDGKWDLMYEGRRYTSDRKEERKPLANERTNKWEYT